MLRPALFSCMPARLPCHGIPKQFHALHLCSRQAPVWWLLAGDACEVAWARNQLFRVASRAQPQGVCVYTNSTVLACLLNRIVIMHRVGAMRLGGCARRRTVQWACHSTGICGHGGWRHRPHQQACKGWSSRTRTVTLPATCELARLLLYNRGQLQSYTRMRPGRLWSACRSTTAYPAQVHRCFPRRLVDC